MNMTAYLRSIVWEFLLVSAAVVAVEYTAFDAFFIAPALQYSIIPGVISTALVAILYLVVYSDKTVRIGVVAYIALCVAALAVAIALSGGGNILDDNEGNWFYPAFIIVLTATLGFLLARKRAGTAFLFIIGAFICAWVQFFYERYEIVLSLVFVLSALALIAYKNYETGAITARSVGKMSFSAGFLLAAALAAASVGAGCLVWFGVIEQLHPGAVKIELINEDRALEEETVRGTSSAFLTPNMELTSNKTNDQSRTTDDLLRDSNGNEIPAQLKSSSTTDQDASGSYQGIDDQSLQNSFDPQQNPTAWWLYLLLLLIIPLLLVVYFVGRRIWRNARLKRMLSADGTEQVLAIYPFLMGRLSRLGLSLPDGITLREFAVNNESDLGRLDAVTGVGFDSLTGIYAAAAYGGSKVSAEEARSFADYYRYFWKAARKYLGNFRYLFKSFRL